MFTEQNTNYCYTTDQIEIMNNKLKKWCESWGIPYNENDIITQKESDYYKYLKQKIKNEMAEKLNQQVIDAMQNTDIDEENEESDGGRKILTSEEKEIISDWLDGLNVPIPDELEVTDKESWAADIASHWEINIEEALEQLERGEGYSSVSLPSGGMVAIETNGDHMFFVSNMES